MLTFTWLLGAAALLAALCALVKARRASKRLERLTESYWELRYEHGQLRARFNQLDPEHSDTSPANPLGPLGDETTPQPRAANAFIPLSSLKR